MQRSTFLIICLLSTFSLCIAQTDSRCRSLHNRTRLPEMCTIYYDDGDGYFNGSLISGLQDSFRRIDRMFQRVSDTNQCVELMTIYLCYYYFPPCDQTTGDIIPVCRRSCALTLNNENCSALRRIITDILEDVLEQDDVVLPGDSCLQTHRSFVNPPQVSEDCLAIENDLNETILLSCIEIPSNSPCRIQLGYSHYAPSTFEGADALFDEIENLIRQLDDLNICRAFISTVICVFSFPACNPITGRILPICSNRCGVVNFVIGECSLEFFRNDPEFPNVNRLLDIFVCDQPESYYNFPLQYIETMDPDDCSSIVSDNTNATLGDEDSTSDGGADNSSNDNMVIIISVVIGVFVVIAVIILVAGILWIRKRKKTKKKYTSRHDSTNEYSEQPNVRYSLHDDHLGLSINYASNAPSPYLTPRGKNMKDGTMTASKSSLNLEVNHFLCYVQDKFSEVPLPVDSITKQGLLGKGAFGVVHKGEMVSSDGSVKAVAIKTIKSGSLDAMKDLVAESSIMKTFHHSNVLPLLGVCIDYNDEDVLKIVIPFMTNGDLRNFLKDSRVSPNNTHEYPKDLCEEKLVKMCFDIAKGMEYLATKRFIHRDLAARNCMVDKFLSIKIADFGLAKDIYSTEYYRVEKHTTLPVKWMAIESLLDGYFDEKTDVWSYGITCWEIFSLGRIPYPGVDNSNVITVLKTGKRLEKPDLCPLEINNLIASTWMENPDERPTFATIVQQLSRNFTIVSEIEETIKDTKETAENNGYISVLPK